VASEDDKATNPLSEVGERRRTVFGIRLQGGAGGTAGVGRAVCGGRAHCRGHEMKCSSAGSAGKRKDGNCVLISW